MREHGKREMMVVMLVIMWHLFNTMLEPGVFGSWEDVVGAAELSDAPQTVEFQGVEECLIHNIKNHI